MREHVAKTQGDHYKNLTDQAALLRESPFFVGSTDLQPLQDKQLILLVLAGVKPVCDVLSGHWVATENGRRTVPDDPRGVSAFLDSLGLVYHLSTSTGYYTRASVAMAIKDLDQYVQHQDDQVVSSRLFGYPETAIQAYLNNQSMADEDQQVWMLRHNVTGIPAFRLSKTHACDEIGVLQRWYEVLQKYDFLT